MSDTHLRPAISPKRYFTATEVERLCGLSWELLQVLEAQLFPERKSKTQGRKRLYQHHEVLQLRRLSQQLQSQHPTAMAAFAADAGHTSAPAQVTDPLWVAETDVPAAPDVDWKLVRAELLQIRALLDDVREIPNSR